MRPIIIISAVFLYGCDASLCPPWGEDPDTAGPACSEQSGGTDGITEGGSPCAAIATFTGHSYEETEEPNSPIWIGSGTTPTMRPVFSQIGLFVTWAWNAVPANNDPALLAQVDGSLAVKVPQSDADMVWIHLDVEPLEGSLTQGAVPVGSATKYEMEDGSWILGSTNVKGATDLHWSMVGTTVRGRGKNALSALAGPAVSNMEETTNAGVGFWPSWGGCTLLDPALDSTG